jgi:tetratricopeptide (TPR) repeat protein
MKISYLALVLIGFGLIFITSCRENSANHHFKNGSAKFQLMDYKGAINDFTQAIILNNKFRDAYYARAISYGVLGKYSEAGADFDKVIQLDPTFIDAYLNRAFYVKEKTGDFNSALSDINKFIDLNKKTNNAFALNNRGFVKLKLNDPKGAFQDIQQSLALDSSNSFAYKNRALIYISLDSVDLACADIRKALELGFTKDYGNEALELSNKHCQPN